MSLMRGRTVDLKTSQLSVHILAAGASVLQQLVQDARLF